MWRREKTFEPWSFWVAQRNVADSLSVQALKVMIRYLPLFLISLLANLALGQTSKLQDLQEKRNAAIQRATAPIDDRYVAELEALLKSSISAGELDEAVQIREELERFKKPSVALITPTPAKKETFSSQWLTGTKWTFVEHDGGLMRTDFQKETFEIHKLDERGAWNQLQGKWRWEVLSESERTVKIFWWKHEETVTISEDLKNILGSKESWKRIEG